VFWFQYKKNNICIAGKKRKYIFATPFKKGISLMKWLKKWCGSSVG
jgi:hypothetical protein